jgi:hypothetical protein
MNYEHLTDICGGCGLKYWRHIGICTSCNVHTLKRKRFQTCESCGILDNECSYRGVCPCCDALIMRGVHAYEDHTKLGTELVIQSGFYTRACDYCNNIIISSTGDAPSPSICTGCIIEPLSADVKPCKK